MTDHERVATGTLLERTAGRARLQARVAEHSIELVHDVLRSVPSHGWPGGWLGRRDRALLVLSELTGLDYEQIAALTAGDLTIANGVAHIKTTGGTTKLIRNDDDLLCGPCALARWVHALDLTVVYPDGRVIAAVIARAVPLTPDSPHLCQSNNAITEVTRRVALLPPIDRWGHPVRVGGARPVPTVRPGQGPAQMRSALRPGGIPFDTVERARGLHHRVGQLMDLGPAA
jgi:hypothetical protein